MQGPIIVGTGLRAAGDRAIDRAIQLGQQWDVEVIAVHAYDPADEKVDTADLEQRLRRVLPSSEAPVTLRAEPGEPDQVLARVARETGASLLAVGAVDFNEVSDYFVGTAVERIVADSPVPVLAVSNRPQGAYGHILSPSDFQLPSRAALEQAAAWFPGLPITLVHAFHVPFSGWQKADYVREEIRDAERKNCDAFLQTLHPDTRARISQRLVHGNEAGALLDALRTQEAALVVIGAARRSGLRAAFGRGASDLLQVVPADTLIVTAG